MPMRFECKTLSILPVISSSGEQKAYAYIATVVTARDKTTVHGYTIHAFHKGSWYSGHNPPTPLLTYQVCVLA